MARHTQDTRAASQKALERSPRRTEPGIDLNTVDQLVPAESVADGVLNFHYSNRRQSGNTLNQGVAADRPQVIAVRYTGSRKPIPLAQANLNWNVADCGRNFGHDELVQVTVSIIPCQQQHRTSAYWFGQIGPPDLELSQGSNFSQFDQESDSDAESG